MDILDLKETLEILEIQDNLVVQGRRVIVDILDLKETLEMLEIQDRGVA